MELAFSLKIKLPVLFLKKSFVNVFGSVEVENVTVTPATRKYWDNFTNQLQFFYIFYVIFINFIKF